jgi:chaperonin GroEL
MAKKKIIYGPSARKKIQEGVNIVVDAVKTSYGPVGRTTVIGQPYGDPTVTNDGVTIAKAIELDGIEQMGVKLVQQAASKTNDEAGDGTTLTTILTGAIINEGIKVVESGADPVKIKSGITKAVQYAKEELQKMAVPVKTKEDRKNVAYISSRSEKVSEIIADILEEVGADGVVTIQNGDTNAIEKEVAIGMRFDKGYKSPYFVTDAVKMEALIENPYILVTDRKVSAISDVVGIIEAVAKTGKKDLVIIADDIDGEALTTFVLNKIRGTFNIYAVQAPSFGDNKKAILEDIAVLIGAEFIKSDLNAQLKDITLEQLGSAQKVIISKDNTTIIGGEGKKKEINARVEYLRSLISNATNDYDKEKLAERLAKIKGGVGVIKVGASSEVEMKELKFVVEDALNATKAAIAEGVVPGGASTLVRLSHKLSSLKVGSEDEKTGVSIIQKAFLAPFRAMAENSGMYDVAIAVREIESSEKTGFDFRAMISVKDMFEKGIIDPKMVLREAIDNSSSVASAVITTQVTIGDLSNEEKNIDLNNNDLE